MEDKQNKKDSDVEELASESLATQLAKSKISKNLLGDIRKETRRIYSILKNWKLENISKLETRLSNEEDNFSKLKDRFQEIKDSEEDTEDKKRRRRRKRRKSKQEEEPTEKPIEEPIEEPGIKAPSEEFGPSVEPIPEAGAGAAEAGAAEAASSEAVSALLPEVTAAILAPEVIVPVAALGGLAFLAYLYKDTGKAAIRNVTSIESPALRQQAMKDLVESRPSFSRTSSGISSDRISGAASMPSPTNTGVTGIGLPGAAKGGVVTKPTLAIIGEGGEKEYIVPQSKLKDFIASKSSDNGNDVLKKPARIILGVVGNFISQFGSGSGDIRRMVGGDILRMERIFGREKFVLPVFTKGEGSFDKIVGDTFKDLVKGRKVGGALSKELYDSVDNLFTSLDDFLAELEKGGVGPSPDKTDFTGDIPSSGKISGNQSQLERQMFSYLTNSVGLTDYQAAGILGNALRESGYRTYAPEGGFRGMFQWDASRWARLNRWAQSSGLDPNDNGTQLQFGLLEAKERGTLSRIKSAKTAQEAAELWYKEVEVAAYTNNYSGSPHEKLNNQYTADVLRRQSGTTTAVSRTQQPPTTQQNIISQIYNTNLTSPTPAQRNQPRATSDRKGYVIIPGHAAGGGAPGEKELVKKLARDAYNKIKSKNPDAPVQFMDLDSRFSDDDAGWEAQKKWYEQMESQGYDVLEVHMDQSQGIGRGVIRSHNRQSGVATEFASKYGAYPMDWRSKPGEKPLAGPHRGVDLFELGKMQSKMYTQEDISSLTTPLVSSVLSSLSNKNAPQQQTAMSVSGLITPSKGILTSRWHEQRGSRLHQGIDIAGPVGTPVVAPEDGKVVYAKWNDGGYGNLVVIKGANGYHLLGHLNKILTSEGQTVKANQQVGEMGNTGRSGGPHLHWQINKSGIFNDSSSIDPLTLSPVDSSGNPIPPDRSMSGANISPALNDRIKSARSGIMRSRQLLNYRSNLPSNSVVAVQPIIYQQSQSAAQSTQTIALEKQIPRTGLTPIVNLTVG